MALPRRDRRGDLRAGIGPDLERVGETVIGEDVATLVAGGQLDNAVELALEQPTHKVTEQLPSAQALDSLPPFLNRWLAALPPLERLQAAAPLADHEQLLECHAATAITFAAKLRDFWSFTDGPDAEVDPAIMDRFGRYADRVESMSFDSGTPRRGQIDVPVPDPAPVSPFDDDAPFEPLPRVSARQNELLSLITSGRQTEALRLALEHRDVWVQIRLDYDAMEINDDASSAFLQSWLPALRPLERLQAAGWASSNFQLALVHLPHAYGIGARLLLEALATAASCWAGLFRDLGAAVISRENPDSSFSRRLSSYADQLDTMSFEPVPIEPED